LNRLGTTAAAHNPRGTVLRRYAYTSAGAQISAENPYRHPLVVQKSRYLVKNFRKSGTDDHPTSVSRMVTSPAAPAGF
jgi:hypothetical protein